MCLDLNSTGDQFCTYISKKRAGSGTATLLYIKIEKINEYLQIVCVFCCSRKPAFAFVIGKDKLVTEGKNFEGRKSLLDVFSVYRRRLR